MQPFKVVCVNDANRPDGIPTSKWVKKGETYTVIAVDKILLQGGQLGFKLEEINIDSCFPYQYFAATRFGIPLEETPWAEEYLEKLLQEAKKETLVES